MSPPSRPAPTLDWSKLNTLKLRARSVAEGFYAGSHRSRRHGSGVEFGGHRPYSPGDDLRWLDRHSLMRHGRLVVREYETDTEQVLWLLLDPSRSMGYRGTKTGPTKYEYATVLAASLARIAVASGDLVALGWLDGAGSRYLAPSGGIESFDRIVTSLEQTRPSFDLSGDPKGVSRAIGFVGRHARRGSVIVVIGDLLDLPDEATPSLLALASRKRTLGVIRVLDPTELQFPFSGPVDLVASEGTLRIETDADASRPLYLRELGRSTDTWRRKVESRGGGFVNASTNDDPVAVVRTVLRAVGGG